jgi:CheY-like chemotaxis protein
VARLLEGVSVLAADDDPDSLELVADVMSDEGATVRTAQDAREALGILHEWKPDVLLLDISMPYMDGYELLSAIRSLTDSHNVPAVAVTGRGYRSDKDRAFAVGFEAHLTRPFELTELIETVRRLASRPAPTTGDPGTGSQGEGSRGP